MNKYKHITIAVLFLFVLQTGISYSQINSTPEYNCLAEKRWSIIVDVGAYLSVIDSTVVKSFSLSGKYHFNKKNALRLSIGVTGSKSSEDINEQYSITNATRNEKLNLETCLQWIHYLSADSKIKVYTGVGPYFGYRHRFTESDDIYEYTVSSWTENEWNLGLAGSFGVEFFFLDNISLIGEYYLTGTYGKLVSKYYDYYNGNQYNESARNNWKFEFNRMRIGFSVYF